MNLIYIHSIPDCGSRMCWLEIKSGTPLHFYVAPDQFSFHTLLDAHALFLLLEKKYKLDTFFKLHNELLVYNTVIW